MTTALEALRDLILDDPDLAEALGSTGDDTVFAERSARAARRPVEAAEIRRALETATLAPAERPNAPPGWLPAQVSGADDRTTVTWRWFGRRRLLEPFYADDLARAAYRPINRFSVLRTPLPREGDQPARAPDGLIFHMSRCGSTLAAQMLAASPANRVISEAPPLDAVLALDLDDDAKVDALRAMVAALGRSCVGETRLILKLDCWHVRDLPLFRRAFPETPWVFVYREPLEVLVSHLRRRGVQMIPSLVPSARLGLDDPGVPDADYCARVLAAICEAAARHHAGDGLLVNYRDLPGALLDRVLPHFGLTPSPEEAVLMRAAAARDAKAPGQAFFPDAEIKRREAGEDLRAICEHRLEKVYRRLEALRTARS